MGKLAERSVLGAFVITIDPSISTCRFNPCRYPHPPRDLTDAQILARAQRSAQRSAPLLTNPAPTPSVTRAQSELSLDPAILPTLSLPQNPGLKAVCTSDRLVVEKAMPNDYLEIKFSCNLPLIHRQTGVYYHIWKLARPK